MKRYSILFALIPLLASAQVTVTNFTVGRMTRLAAAAPAFTGTAAAMSGGTGGTAFTATTAAVSAGKRVVAIITRNTADAVTGVADTRGNTWTIHAAQAWNGEGIAIASADIATPLQAGDTITATGGDVWAEWGVVAYELSGVTAVDSTATNTITYNSTGTLPGTTTAAAVIVGVVRASDDTSATYSHSWTTIETSTAHGGSEAFIRYDAAGAGAQNPSGTWSGPMTWVGAWVAFK